MSKFKEGDKVKIVIHPDENYLGKVGIVTKVIDGSQIVQSDNGSITSGLYKVKVDGHTVPDYAEDDCIELMKEARNENIRSTR